VAGRATPDGRKHGGADGPLPNCSPGTATGERGTSVGTCVPVPWFLQHVAGVQADKESFWMGSTSYSRPWSRLKQPSCDLMRIEDSESNGQRLCPEDVSPVIRQAIEWMVIVYVQTPS
jgi:hypothetical protein